MDFEKFIKRVDNKYLKVAFTHSSYANESKGKKIEYNERIEFLGDSVLSIVTSQYLYTHYKNMSEGDLSKLRSALVCESALFLYAKEINLGKYLLLGKGEEATKGRERSSILADAFEATLGAIYLSGGLDLAREFALPFIEKNVQNAIDGLMFKDYKTKLQEIIQQNQGERLTYVLDKTEGPDHNKTFWYKVYLNSNLIGTGAGRSKKDAEQMAAKEALKLMGE